MTRPTAPDRPAQPESLRDARLAHALQNMPDAHMQPNAQTRQAVLQAAMGGLVELRGAALRRWWQSWFDPSRQTAPWSAALTTVVIVGFVTVLWHGKEVPDTHPADTPHAQRKAADTAASEAVAVQKNRDAPPASRPLAEKRATLPSAMAPVPSERKSAGGQVPIAPQVAVPPLLGAGDDVAKLERNTVAAPAAALQATTRQAPASTPAQGESVQAAQADSVAHGLAKARNGSNADMELMIAVGGVQRSLAAEPAQRLLGLLRGFSYNAEPAEQHVAPSLADVVVDAAGAERWIVAPGHVVHLTLATQVSRYSVITPAQYAAVRHIIQEAGLPLY